MVLEKTLESPLDCKEIPPVHSNGDQPWVFFGTGMKTDLSSPVATAEFSKFAGVLSEALLQHHLLGFEIAQLGFHYLHYLCS